MKEYVILTIKNDEITFNYRSINEHEKEYVNKDSFYNNSLYYANKYFKNHYESIIDLLKEQPKLNTLIIKRLITFRYAVILMIRLKISILKLDFASTIGLQDYELFLSVHYLKEIDCYFMPRFIKDKFNEKGVLIKEYNVNKVSDRFMLQIDSFDYETLYYKKNLEIKENYHSLINDIEEFLRINYNLKAIHIHVFSKELIENIIDLVKNDEARNVVVFLHQGHDKGNFIVENFKWLKSLNKKCKEEYTCEFRIIYSNDFLSKNLFKQLTFNNLKLISILAIYVSLSALLIVKSYDYVEKLSVDELNNELINGSLGATENLEDGGISLENELSKEEIKSKYTFDKVFSTLKKKNKETVGFLVVNNTNISYPIVQHSDNNYYLKRDFYKKKTSMGWTYLDYRNNSEELDDNNIIYGHSMLNGTMFGTLHKVLNSTWRKNDENMIITYETEESTYYFKIFAGYRVDYTTDYLKTNFDSEDAYDKFVKMIKGRSIFSSKTEVKYGDKILTLSTCTGTKNRRLVVHAVLMDEEDF